MNEGLKKIVKQNEIIISLLGRIAFHKEEVKKIVTFKKQNPKKYIQGYNSLDGNHSLSAVARIIGVKPPTLSPILSEWEDIGIIREVKKSKGKFYNKLFSIEE